MSNRPNTSISSNFNLDKARESILYVAKRIPDPTFHSVSKILYFADKLSLEKYGRLISGDTYAAMRFGPVPSNTYELMKAAPANGSLGFRVENKKEIIALQDAKLDELSESDIESLDTVIAIYGKMPFNKRTELSHDEAWAAAWKSKGNGGNALMSIESIAKSLNDGENLLEHLQTRHD